MSDKVFTKNTFNGGLGDTLQLMSSNVIVPADAKPGDPFTMSAYVTYTNIVPKSGLPSDKKSMIAVSAKGNITGWNSGAITNKPIDIEYNNPQPTTVKFIYKGTFDTRMLSNTYLIPYLVGDYIQSGIVSITNMKFELGDVIPVWSKAFEDSSQLLKNATWEYNNTNWTLGSGWYKTESIRFNGSRCMGIDRSGLTETKRSSITSSYIKTTKPGAKYTFSIYAKSPNISGIDGESSQIELMFTGNSGYVKSEVSNIKLKANNEWQKISLTGSVPDNATNVAVSVNVYRNGVLYFCNPMLESGTTASEFKLHIDDIVSSIVNKSDNLVNNVTFKNGATGWNFEPGWSVSNSILLDGSPSAGISRSGLQDDMKRIRQNSIICKDPGGEYTMSIYSRTSSILGIDGKDPELEMTFIAQGGSVIESKKCSIKPTNINEWQRFSITSISPENTARIMITVSMYRNGNLFVSRPMVNNRGFIMEWAPNPNESSSTLDEDHPQILPEVDTESTAPTI